MRSTDRLLRQARAKGGPRAGFFTVAMWSAALVIVGTSCSAVSQDATVAVPGPTQSQRDDGPAEWIMVTADVDYADTFAELVTSSDLVVTGRLGQNEITLGESSDGLLRHVATDFVVAEVLRGETEGGSVIQVQRTVVAGDVALVSEDIANLESGRDYVLFLQDADRDGVYSVVGATQGAFALTDGRLAALPPSTPGSDPQLPGWDVLVGKTVNEVRALIDSAQ